ncbi:DUF7620 family protein [Streptomyces griseofuscus]|uniref:DUF7620 family protein n=1 Tax=Streptomyces griseofuscus TaxID=146922 RepID=UPI003F4D2305
MGWIAHLTRRGKPSPDREAAEQALEEAREARREIQEERLPIVLDVVRRLRVAREENHFAERIAAAYRGAAQ